MKTIETKTVKYTATLTINLHFESEDEESAQAFLEDADFNFSNDGKPIENDLIDWEIKEQLK